MSSELRALEVLKAIGKTLSQMTLYSASHPAVRGLMADSVRVLGEVLSQSGGTVSYSVDHDKLIANGHVIGQAEQVPSSVLSLFKRFKLSRITFRSGVTDDEMASLCRLASMKPEALQGKSPGDHLGSAGVKNIALNEAVYAKVEGDAPAPPPGAAVQKGGAPAAAAPAETAAAPDAQAAELLSLIEAQSLDKTIATLVSYAVRDPKQQVAVMQTVLKRIESDLESRVQEATRDITYQRNVFQNEATRTQAVLGQVAEGVVVVDEQGKVLMMNPEAEELFEAQLASAAGKALPDLVKKEEHLLAISKEISTPKERAINKDVDVVSTNDAMRTLRSSTVLVQNEAGKPVGVVSSITDKAKHRELEKMERAFVAHVTHELRAPLSAIHAALEILNESVGGASRARTRR